MTTDEYSEISYLLKNAWPGQFSEDNEAAYSEFLLPYDRAVVIAALHKLTRDGAVFVPSVGQIVAAVNSVVAPPVPSWTEAWDQIVTAMKNKRNADPYVDVNELVTMFIKREGLERLSYEPFYDPDKGGMIINQLRTRWLEFVDVQRAKDSRSHALAAGGLTAVEQADRAVLLEQSVERGVE